MKMYTSRFANKALTNTALIPVRISRGHPRFKIGYKIEHKIEELMPEREMFDMSLEDGQAALFEKWDKIGVEAIRDILEKLADGKRHIVCLCFENVNEGEDCHRRMFAEWWEANTGEVIEEL